MPEILIASMICSGNPNAALRARALPTRTRCHIHRRCPNAALAHRFTEAGAGSQVAAQQAQVQAPDPARPAHMANCDGIHCKKLTRSVDAAAILYVYVYIEVMITYSRKDSIDDHHVRPTDTNSRISPGR